MNRKVCASFSTQALFVAVALSLAGSAHAQEAKALYTNMAPLAQYLMTDQNAEVTLARTAAISRPSLEAPWCFPARSTTTS